jgi:hypothetical protein
MGAPLKATSPEAGAVRPIIDRNVVLLLAPFLPIRLTTSPFSTASDTSKRIWLRP